MNSHGKNEGKIRTVRDLLPLRELLQILCLSFSYVVLLFFIAFLRLDCTSSIHFHTFPTNQMDYIMNIEICKALFTYLYFEYNALALFRIIYVSL